MANDITRSKQQIQQKIARHHEEQTRKNLPAFCPREKRQDADGPQESRITIGDLFTSCCEITAPAACEQCSKVVGNQAKALPLVVLARLVVESWRAVQEKGRHGERHRKVRKCRKRLDSCRDVVTFQH